MASVTLLVIVAGMAYCVWWPSLVGYTTLPHSTNFWDEPIDMWVTVKASHDIADGLISYIYSNSRPPVTLPGFAVVLTPFVMLATALHLSQSFQLGPAIFWIPHPTALLLLGPIMMACAGVALVGFDSLAAILGVSRTRRRMLSVLEAAALAPTIVFWGHPEDVVAMGLCAFATAVSIRNPRSYAIGWLLGAAIAFQLWAIFVLPVIVGFVGVRRSWGILGRAAILPGAIFLVMLIPNPGPTFRALTEQITYRGGFLHTTPWVALSPTVRGGVAGGPPRVLGAAAAIGIGIVASRFRDRPLGIVWLCGLALAARCIFEPVMLSYYLGPTVGYALVAASSRTHLRWLVVSCLGGGVLLQTYAHLNMWTYWLAMLGLVAAMYGVAWPSRGSFEMRTDSSLALSD
ncbi:MAG: hypothetical protein M0Z46_08710 [Actinomycetota bacterium]|nr:hypothetical protein [Actinomycetota bacterium]